MAISAQKRAYKTQYMRGYRARKRAEKQALQPKIVVRKPVDPIKSLAIWSRNCLKVPPGHPLAGRPMELQNFAIEFLKDAFNAQESALCNC